MNKEAWKKDALNILGAKYLFIDLKMDMIMTKAVQYQIPQEYANGFIEGVSAGASSNLVFRENVVEKPVKEDMAELHNRMRADTSQFSQNAWTKNLPVFISENNKLRESTVQEYFGGTQMPPSVSSTIDELLTEISDEDAAEREGRVIKDMHADTAEQHRKDDLERDEWREYYHKRKEEESARLGKH